MLYYSNSRVLETKKGWSLTSTSAVVELPTLNPEVQGVNFVLNGFSLNANCTEIFLGHPPLYSCNSFTQPSSTIIYPYTLFISFKELSTLLFSLLFQEGRVHFEFVHHYIPSISHTGPSTHSRHAKNSY